MGMPLAAVFGQPLQVEASQRRTLVKAIANRTVVDQTDLAKIRVDDRQVFDIGPSNVGARLAK